MSALVWFRQDLRISDNPALVNALKDSDKVAAIYILDEKTKGVRALGGASKWWLHYALDDLSRSLKEHYNIELQVYEGEAQKILEKLVKENNISAIYWNRLYEPYHIDRDKKIKAALDCEVNSYNANLLNEPWDVKNGAGSYYKVFTSYYKYCLANKPVRDAIKVPKKQAAGFKLTTKSLKLDELELKPTKPNWAKTFYEYWDVSEKAAQDHIYDFLENKAVDYKEDRDFPIGEYTSKLSPYLHLGQISPVQIVSVCNHFEATDPKTRNGTHKFVSEIYWREFSYHLLYHFPIHEKNFNVKFDKFPWEKNAKGLKAWQKGMTGYPIVDAGLRELWHTGWMHNRVRMIVGSFLTKDLILHWKEGEEWFWDTLLDADLANNCASWQWVAGSGADASPYFRIFNPITQGEKFDAKGEYVRKWCPELKNLPDEYVHKPWEAPEMILKAAGIKLGKDYPMPLVDHKKAREDALRAYSRTK